MSELIDRLEAIDALDCLVTEVDENGDELFRKDEAYHVIEVLPTAQPEPHWIPVSERMPEVGQTIIAQCRANIIKTLKLDSDGDWYQDAEHCYMSGFVVAWMPLPEAYKPNK